MKDTRLMRVALFGGTFDPPHRGHLAVARAAADGFDLDRVLFAPAGRQPLKPGDRTAPFNDRLAMVALLCESDERFETSVADAPNSDGSPNYTVDTLDELGRLNPEAALFNLVGADSFLDLPRWREPERLLELAEWIVVSRPGFRLDDLGGLSRLSRLGGLHLTPDARARVHLLETVHEDVSATDLRRRLRKGDPCEDLIPPDVRAYIRTHHLYGGRV